MKVGRVFLAAVFLLLGVNASAFKNHITSISFSRSRGEYECRIVSAKRVPFGSIWLPENKRLVIYIRESSWEGEDKPIFPDEGPIKQILARQSAGDANVVEVILDFNKNRKYRIDYDGLDIVAYIEGENPLSRNIWPAGKMAQRIEQKSPLSDPHKISMDFRRADLPNVLRLLAKQNNINIVSGKDVTDTITISLRNVTLKEALDNILLANGYDYVMEDKIVLVKPLDKYYPTLSRTKIYRLKYIDAENLKNVIQEVVPTEAKIQVFSPDFYSSTEVTGTQNPDLTVKRRSSTLIVTGRSEVIEKIDRLVEQLDVPTPQIVIESKLLELSPKQNEKIGINWDKTLTASLMDEDLLPSGEKKPYSVLNEGLPKHSSWKLGHLSASQFNIVLDFLRENTETKLISNPRITTSDNVTSTISVGTTFPVPQINRGIAGQGDMVTFEYKDVNIQLNVTPHVVNDSEIIMYVNPVIEEVTGELVIDVNRAPITSKRTVNTVVTVKDGETIVIGGMIKEDSKKITSKVFLLGDIPLLGNLFRHTSYEKQQKDLVIFITPHILR